MQRLLTYPWPGNIRELRHTMAYVAATADGGLAEERHLPERIIGRRTTPTAPQGEAHADGANQAGAKFRPIKEELADLERTRIVEALEAAGGVQTHAAELITMPERTFFKKMKEYHTTLRKVPSR